MPSGNGNCEGEKMRGRIVTAEEQLIKDRKRERNFKRRQKERRDDEIRKNYNFCDDPVEDVCERCGETVIDVYPFRVELSELKQRITGYPIKKICEGCYGLYVSEGATLVTVPSDDGFARREPVQVYDNKPRVKLF